MTAKTSPQAVVRLQRTIPAPPAKVYRAWLDPELVREWLTPDSLKVTRVEIDERIGGHYRVWQGNAEGEMGGFECQLLELIPDQRIAWRWGFVGPERTAGPVFDSLLTVTLDEAPKGATTLTLVHERLDELAAAMPRIVEQVGTGWGMAFEKLSLNLNTATLTEAGQAETKNVI